ncbi:MAG: RHS repeat-associated core domain-containing protein, partial [Cytophagales bacterium]|nr:RHS repeat-associated core domain-containing protein [Cytophagales bacterium]
TFSTTPENYTRTETFESGEDNGFADLHRHTNANANTTVGGNEVELLQSNQTGAMAMIQVDKGDTVKLSVQANYESVPSGNTFAETAFALLFNAFDGAYGASSGEGGISGGSASEFDDALNGSGMTSKSDASSAPRAFLNYIYFDDEMQHHTAGFEQVTTGALGIGIHESVVMDEIIADKGGYIMVYLSNENSEAVNMHFDDLEIYHGKTNVVQADDYYPFGGAFNSFTRSYSEPQKYKFGGKELQEETGLYDFEARMYDPWLGRFNSVDPLADITESFTPYHYVRNNPLIRVDPTGLTDYTLNKKTGDVSEVTYDDDDEQKANDGAKTDRIVKTKKDGTIKRKKDGTVKTTSVKGIEKGILADGQNFKTEDNIIEVGGEGQPTDQGVETFALKMSQHIGKELSGTYFSTSEGGRTSQMTIGQYQFNSHTKSVANGDGLGITRGLYRTGYFHTHPGNGNDIANSDRTVPSDPDLTSRNNKLRTNPNLRFFILTKPVRYGDRYPMKIEYTKGFSFRLK